MFESLSLLATVVLLDVIHLHFKVLFMHKSSFKEICEPRFSYCYFLGLIVAHTVSQVD